LPQTSGQLPAPSFRDDRERPLATVAAPALQVTPLAPRSADDVLGVGVTFAGDCTPGAVCTVRVDVGLRMAVYARPVNWTLKAINPCTGETAVLAVGSITAQAGWTRVVTSRALRTPGTATALVAVVETPAYAASSLVPLGSASC
jgi:hypothetical protein